MMRLSQYVSIPLVFALSAFGAFGCSSASHREDDSGSSIYDQLKTTSSRDDFKPRPSNEVAPGYEIKLATTEDPRLNGTFRIEFESRLKLPYNVVLSTENLTLEKLRVKINDAYSKYFKNPPHIRVSVSEERYWIDVRGLVEKPGRFLMKKGSSIDEALGLAGGLQKNGTASYVKIQQGRSSTTIKLSDYYSGSSKDRIPPWRGADIVFFQTDRGDSATPDGETEKTYVQVIGEVKTPGEYHFMENSDFYYYLVKAGGPTDRANMGEIRIVRNGAEGKKIIDFDSEDLKNAPSVQPGDILFLQADKQTALERKLPIISGIVGAISTVLLAILVLR